MRLSRSVAALAVAGVVLGAIGAAVTFARATAAFGPTVPVAVLLALLVSGLLVAGRRAARCAETSYW